MEENRQDKKKKKLGVWAIIAMLIGGYLVLGALFVYIVDARHVRFYMTQSDSVDVEFGENYTDPGIYAVTAGRVLGEGKKQLEITPQGQVDTGKLGEYTLSYTARFLFRNYTTERTVTVRDTTKPVLELRHTDNYTASWLTGYEEEGYSATDACDGDLTDKVEVSRSDDIITYTVTDSSGNTAEAQRTIVYSTTAPEIVLKGESELYITAGMYFTDPGYAAADEHGNDMSSFVQVSGSVTPYIAGSYQLLYTIGNTAGEQVSAARNVYVQAVGRPDIRQPSGKTIYLTFDDGPGPYTGALLDVLAAYGAKATFFVTAADKDNRDMIGRAYSEGHSIGVHTFSHDYNSIYASENAYFEDLNAIEEIVRGQTGSYTHLLRFPGGSSNTVSSFNPGIMSRLTTAMNDMGYRYFDWNVSSGDAGETRSTEKVAQNIIDGCSQRTCSVVLQHDIKDYSVAAVEQVLIWGLNNGYSFEALSMTSPDAHHGIAN